MLITITPRALLPAVRTCDECYLKSTAWDATRSCDVFGQSGDKAVVLVHAALVGRHSLVLEAKALAEVGFRWVYMLKTTPTAFVRRQGASTATK